MVVSEAVTSTKPSPEAICCVETAPALPQAVEAVLVRELPETVTPTAEVHTTGTAPLGGGVVVSSFVIVPCPWPSARVAPDGLERLTRNVSFGSTVVSPLTVTLIVLLVCPAVKLSEPVAAT